MFTDFYGLSRDPFGAFEPAGDSYMSPSQREALDRLHYAALNRKFACLTGVPGTGKTTILRFLKFALQGTKHLVFYVADSRLGALHLYNDLLGQLGHKPSYHRADSRRRFHREIESASFIDRLGVVAVVDEAHLLSTETIEEIRFLLNSNMDAENPLALVLSGQTELGDKLNMRASAAIKQRVDLFCRLPPFDRAETAAYLQARLRRAGMERAVFTEAAVDAVFEFTSGVARRINKLCAICLMHGGLRRAQLIDDDMVNFIIDSEMM